MTFPQVSNVPFRGESELEQKAHMALEAQLLHTERMIHTTLNEHAHYTDDCGEYLSSALELSANLMSARENGTEELLGFFKELAELDEEDDSEDKLSKVFNNYASDGITKEVSDFIMELGGKDYTEDAE